MFRDSPLNDPSFPHWNILAFGQRFPLSKCIRDFHPIVNTHAGRIKKVTPCEVTFLFNDGIVLKYDNFLGYHTAVGFELQVINPGFKIGDVYVKLL